MKIPDTPRAFLKMMIAIAENGNPYCDKKLSEEDQMRIGEMIADLQNNIGEMRDILAKYNLTYNALP